MKSVRLHNTRLQQIFIDNNAAERIEGEQPTMQNVLQMRRRRNGPTINALRDQEGVTQTTPRGIARTLVTYLCGKYKRIEVNTECVHQLRREVETDPNSQYPAACLAPFFLGEIEQAIEAGGRKKTPGRDGLSSDFFRHLWEITQEEAVEISNQTFWDGHINHCQKQKQNLPKRRGTNDPRDFRPITLLNADYKILARIIAQRLRPVLAEHFKDTQSCGVSGNSILDAAATIRKTIAFAETESVPLCVLSIDHKNAFDNIAHEYLFQTLRRFGISDPFVHGIMNMYKGASSLSRLMDTRMVPYPYNVEYDMGPCNPSSIPPPEDGRN